MNHVFAELLSKTEYLLDTVVVYGFTPTWTVRRCEGGCSRWIRFCTAEITICGACSDDRRREMEDIEDHNWLMREVMTELITVKARQD